MSPVDNKAIVRQYIRAMNHGYLEVIDQTFAADNTVTPLWPDSRKLATLSTLTGIGLVKRAEALVRTAFPDLTVTIEALVAEGETVLLCTTSRGIHTGGPFLEVPATGKVVHWATFLIYRLIDGKIVEERVLWDRLGVLQQLGRLPDQDTLWSRTTPVAAAAG